MNRYLQMATVKQFVDEAIKHRGEQLERQGVKAIVLYTSLVLKPQIAIIF